MHSSPEEGGWLPQRKIGSVFLSMGLITEEQLKEALEIQNTDSRRLGKILVSLGYVTSDELARALSTSQRRVRGALRGSGRPGRSGAHKRGGTLFTAQNRGSSQNVPLTCNVSAGVSFISNLSSL